MGKLTILAIDTSTDWACVGLRHGGRTVEHNWDVGRHGTTAIAPVIETMLDQAGILVSDLDAVAVAVGPGSFSGLRVGLSLAKGFAMATEIPLIGIPTMAIALARIPEGIRGAAVLRAGRSRLVWATTADPATYVTGKIDDFRAAVAAEEIGLIAGELQSGDAARIADAGVHVLGAPDGYRQASDLLDLAEDRLAAGRTDDPIALSPIYLHPGSGPA